MLKLTDTQRHELHHAVMAMQGRADIIAAVEALYGSFQKDLDARKPRCDRSGRCCNFEKYDHRLFVTTAELIAFTSTIEAGEGFSSSSNQFDAARSTVPLPDACMFQVDLSCSVHEARPLGCRIFFCDSTSSDWQHQHYESLHKSIRSLHDRFDIPYFYVEWRDALRTLGVSTPKAIPQVGHGSNTVRLNVVRSPSSTPIQTT